SRTSRPRPTLAQLGPSAIIMTAEWPLTYPLFGEAASRRYVPDDRHRRGAGIPARHSRSANCGQRLYVTVSWSNPPGWQGIDGGSGKVEGKCAARGEDPHAGPGGHTPEHHRHRVGDGPAQWPVR